MPQLTRIMIISGGLTVVVWMRRRNPEWQVVTDKVQFVSAARQCQPELGGHNATAAVCRVADDADNHDFSPGVVHGSVPSNPTRSVMGIGSRMVYPSPYLTPMVMPK